MRLISSITFWGSLFLLLYVYFGYPACLLAGRLIWRRKTAASLTGQVGGISVVVAARDEQSVIMHRITNILAQSYPVDEIIIGCDGSQDRTADIARAFPDPRVKILNFHVTRGRALVHNDCVAAAGGEIVVFTDAAVEFAPGFLREIVSPFTDSSVAVSTGRLLWRSGGSERTGWYWGLELFLRRLESSLGLLATASGPCMAVRKSCYQALLRDEDVDFTTPLQAARRGLKVAYVPTAIATDDPYLSPAEEFRARSRMVTKNLVGTLRELGKSNPATSPGLWWTSLSHKVLRWLTPVFVLLIPVAVLGVGNATFLKWVLTAYGTGAIAIAIGGAWSLSGMSVPVASQAWSLAVANAGMLAGLMRAAAGHRISSYRTAQHPAAVIPDHRSS